MEEDEITQIAQCINPIPPVNDTWISQHLVSNYALELIEANCAWSISKGSADIQIGIADTDFEITHDDLKNQITSINGIISVKVNHGTYVAGLASAETNNNIGIAGIGYNSKIAAYRVYHFDDEGHTYHGNIKSSIWSLYKAGIKIINVSWTNSGLDFLAAKEITENGTVLILAAGNDPNIVNHSLIANIPGVIIVTSVNSNNEHGPTNNAHNEFVDICAPGIDVVSTYDNNTYSTIRGTSFAAPLVSGTIALMLEVNPFLTPSKIEQIVKQAADPVADGSNFINLIGAGRLNAYKAVMESGTKEYNGILLSGNKNITAGFGFKLTNTNIGINSNIILTARKEAVINSMFEIPLGSTFEINIDNTIRSSYE